MLALGISVGGDFSTLNSSIAVPPRYLYAMAREGSMPKIFSKLHPKYGTPWVAILFLGVLSLILVKYPITFVASVSLFADLFYYIIGIAAAWGLRHRLPDLKRPFKAPMVEIGVPVSIIIYFIMMTQLDQDAIVSGIIWCVAGIVVYWFCRRQNSGIEEVRLETLIADTPEPTAEEKLAMDKDYRFWKRVTATFFILSLLIYAVPVFF
jgi:APA family basic amino acid/polyamine antiporter